MVKIEFRQYFGLCAELGNEVRLTSSSESFQSSHSGVYHKVGIRVSLNNLHREGIGIGSSAQRLETLAGKKYLLTGTHLSIKCQQISFCQV